MFVEFPELLALIYLVEMLSEQQFRFVPSRLVLSVVRRDGETCVSD